MRSMFPLLPPQPCKHLPGTFILAPEQSLGSRGAYQDVDQDQLRLVSALLMEPLLHTGLRGIRLKPTAVAVQAVMNLQETFEDLSGDKCLEWRGPVENFSCSEENKIFLRILSKHEIVSEREAGKGSEAELTCKSPSAWRRDNKVDGDRLIH